MCCGSTMSLVVGQLPKTSQEPAKASRKTGIRVQHPVLENVFHIL